MANTTSLTFPNIFDVSRNRASIAEDSASIVSRVKLLILTEPTELYNSPTYGVGLKRYLFQYNNENVIAQIKDKIIEQLRIWEPCVEADLTQVSPGLLFSGAGKEEYFIDANHLKITVMLVSKYGDNISVDVSI